MTGPALVLAWSLSLLLPALETASSGRIALPGVSKLALALLPWVALAGLPRGPRASGAFRPWRAALAALPPVALGAGLEAARGPAALAPAEAGPGLALAAGLFGFWLAAASASGRGRALAGAAWCVLVPGTAALHAALAGVTFAEGSGGAGEVGPLVLWLGRSNALVWLQRWARERSPDLAGGALALALAILVWGVARLAGARATAEERA